MISDFPGYIKRFAGISSRSRRFRGTEFYVSSNKKWINYTNMVLNREQGSDRMTLEQAIRLRYSRNGGNADA
jgi:hypothetical protein